MNLELWAKKHNISQVALDDFKSMVGILESSVKSESTRTGDESKNQNNVVQESSEKGGRLYRNNVGATAAKIHTKCMACGKTHVAYQQPVRYGLCNESTKVNQVFKSSDLVGLMPVLITPEMVGATIGQFTAREIKHTGWKYTGTEREQGQLNWINLVLSLGGNACFATGPGTL